LKRCVSYKKDQESITLKDTYSSIEY